MNINFLQVMSDVTQALIEDIGNGDVTAALLPAHAIAQAKTKVCTVNNSS